MKKISGNTITSAVFIGALLLADQAFYKPLAASHSDLQRQNRAHCENLLQLISEAGRDAVEEKRNGMLQNCRFGSTLG